MDALKEYMQKPVDTAVTYKTLQDQIVTRDVCLVIDKEKSWDMILDPIRKLDAISDIEIFDLYAGNKLPEGKKSIAFTFSIQGDGTMTSEHINAIIQDVVQTAEKH